MRTHALLLSLAALFSCDSSAAAPAPGVSAQGGAGTTSSAPPVDVTPYKTGMKIIRPEVLGDVLENSFFFRYSAETNVDAFTPDHRNQYPVYVGGVDYDNVTTRSTNVLVSSPLVLRRMAFEYCDNLFRTGSSRETFRNTVLADSTYDYDESGVVDELDWNADSNGDGKKDITLIDANWHTYDSSTNKKAIEHFIDRAFIGIRSRPIPDGVHASALDLFQQIEEIGRCRQEVDGGTDFDDAEHCKHQEDWKDDEDADGNPDALVDATAAFYPWTAVCAYFFMVEGGFGVY